MASRIENSAPPGSLLKRPRELKRKAGQKRARIEQPDHLSAIRLCPCLKCGMEPAGVAAHVRMSSATHGKPNPGMQTKPDDKWTVPLCQSCHDEQHREGELSFWNDLGINPLLVCERLHLMSPNVAAMKTVIVATCVSQTTAIGTQS